MHSNKRRSMVAMGMSSIVFFVLTLGVAAGAFHLYGETENFSLDTVGSRAAADTLSAITVEQLQPMHAPSLQSVALSFVGLSIAEVFAAEHSVAAIRQTVLTDVPGPIGWTRLMTNLASGARDVRRLTVGWALDTGAQNLEATLGSTPALSVFAPKWLHVDGTDGTFAQSMEPGVVSMAKKRGIKVWAVVDNGFNAELSHKILQYKDKQDLLISRLVKYALNAHVDGINVDFEGLSAEDRWNYQRFLSVLGAKLHAHHLVLSVDLPPDIISGQNDGPYDHPNIARAVDDVILMGYDEHWTGDTEAGPTAAIPWVNQAVQDMLETGIPADKLILGVPFYTQDWSIAKDGEVIDSQPLSLIQLNHLIARRHLTLRWNTRIGLHYATYVDSDHVKHEIWVEDSRSLLLSLEQVEQKHLAGAAAWYLGLEHPYTWESLVDSVQSAIS